MIGSVEREVIPLNRMVHHGSQYCALRQAQVAFSKMANFIEKSVEKNWKTGMEGSLQGNFYTLPHIGSTSVW